jgi:uncharacterized protein YlxW (UPF0749 family)
MTSRHTTAVPPARPADASMSLLNNLQRSPLDPGYAEAARRRAAGEPEPSGAARVALVLLAVLLGAMVVWSALTLRSPSDGAVAARAALEAQVRESHDDVARITEQNAATAAEIEALQERVLGSQDPDLLALTQRWSVDAGTAAVTGAGLRIVVADAADGQDPVSGDDGRVRDADLQVLVNGLWSAGAEAIAVNGQRLTGTAAIRSAGSAVLVDLVPLASPYTVEAIGDAPAMQARLVASQAGQHLATLHATYGIGVDVSSQQHLSLPQAPVTTLRSASVPDDALVAAGLADTDADAQPDVSGSSPTGGSDG